MLSAAAHRGLGEAPVSDVVARSGVSRRTFYEHFDSRETCFLAALEDALSRARSHVLAAVAHSEEHSWEGRIRAGLAGLLSFLDAEPVLARALIVESLGAGPSVHELRTRTLATLALAVEEGHSLKHAHSGLTTASPLAETTAEGVVGGVLSILHTRMLERHSAPLLELTGPLMGMVVLPYLGPHAADRESRRPTPKPFELTPTVTEDPLGDLPMRLTYRTVRVLVAIAQHPGGSNREIGRAAGVEDQGQISKLLLRLAKLELVANGVSPHERGAPNSWTLTERGRDVERLVSRSLDGS